MLAKADALYLVGVAVQDENGESALVRLREEYEEQIPRRHPHFILGTMKAHPHVFIVIGILRTGIDPADLDRQSALF